MGCPASPEVVPHGEFVSLLLATGPLFARRQGNVDDHRDVPNPDVPGSSDDHMVIIQEDFETTELLALGEHNEGPKDKAPKRHSEILEQSDKNNIDDTTRPSTLPEPPCSCAKNLADSE